MKAAFIAESAQKRGGAKRKPLRTTAELADELGIAVTLLRFHLGSDPAAPKCVLNHLHGQKVHSNRWYERGAVITWWRSIKPAKPTPETAGS